MELPNIYNILNTIIHPDYFIPFILLILNVILFIFDNKLYLNLVDKKDVDEDKKNKIYIGIILFLLFMTILNILTDINFINKGNFTIEYSRSLNILTNVILILNMIYVLFKVLGLNSLLIALYECKNKIKIKSDSE